MAKLLTVLGRSTGNSWLTSEGTGLETVLWGLSPFSSISVFSTGIEVNLGLAMVSRGKGMATIPEGVSVDTAVQACTLAKGRCLRGLP